MTTLHLDLLRLLGGAGQFGLTLDALLGDLRHGRHRGLTLPQLETAIRELADRSLATPYGTALGLTRWRITGVGVSALQEEGLA